MKNYIYPMHDGTLSQMIQSGPKTRQALANLPTAKLPPRLSEEALNDTIETGVGVAVPKVAAPLTLPEAMPFLSRLDRGLSAVWLHLGDSTGAGNTTTDKRWVYQTAENLAAQFPNTHVRLSMWDDTVLSYPAPTVIQEASGERCATFAGDGYAISDFKPAYAISGDIDIRVEASYDTVATEQTLAARFGSGGARSWRLMIDPSGKLNFGWTADGSTEVGPFQSVNWTPAAPGVKTWHRVTLTVNNGAGGHTIRFYSSTDGVSWALVNELVRAAGATNIFKGVMGLQIGARGDVSAGANLTGNIYQVEVRDGIGGQVVNPVRPDNFTTFYKAPMGGSPVLDIYNASASGKNAAYTQASLPAMGPIFPHFLSVSHGLNESLQGIAVSLPNLARAVCIRWPNVQLAFIAQNPKTPAAADYLQHLGIRQFITEFTSRNGYGLLDVTGEFLSVPDWASTLVQSDTIHPTVAGYKLWADFIKSRLTYQPRATTRRAPSQPNMVRIPAGLFTPSSGTPEMKGSAVDRPFGGWALDPSIFESVATITFIPYEWEKVKVTLLWTVPTEPGGNAGAVTWQVYAYDMPTTYPNAYGTRHDLGAITSAAVPTSGAINKLYIQNFNPDTSYEMTKRGPVAITICRFANQGGDTLDIDAILVGVDIERMD